MRQALNSDSRKNVPIHGWLDRAPNRPRLAESKALDLENDTVQPPASPNCKTSDTTFVLKRRRRPHAGRWRSRKKPEHDRHATEAQNKIAPEAGSSQETSAWAQKGVREKHFQIS